MGTGRKALDHLAGPRKLGPYPDRDLDCQESLEADFLRLIERAEAAGWLRDEAYGALVELIEHQAVGDRAAEADRDGLSQIIRGAGRREGR